MQESEKMIRYTHTEKWDDPWFSELSKDAMFVFLYLCDKVDSAGFLEYSARKIAFETKTDPVDVKDLIIPELCKPRIGDDDEPEYSVILHKGWIYLPNFLKRQGNYPINPRNRAHWKIREQFMEQAIRFAAVPFYAAIKAEVVASLSGDDDAAGGLPIASRDDLKRAPKDWEAVKQKCMGGLNPMLRNDNLLRERFEAWWDHRMTMGDPLELPMWRELQISAMEHGPEVIKAAISYSIGNGLKTINWMMAKRSVDESPAAASLPAKSTAKEPEGWREAFLAAFADAEPPKSFWDVAKSRRKHLYKHDPHLEERVGKLQPPSK